MGALVVLILAGVGLTALVIGRRRKRQQPLDRLRHGVEHALEDIEKRVAELRKQARKVSGEARNRLQDQAHELEMQQRELRGRLQALGTDVQKLLERARARAGRQDGS